MAIRKKCLYCGQPVRANNYCMACSLNQDFLAKAYNTSAHYYNIGLDKARVRDLSGAIDSLKMSLRYNKQNIESRNLLGLIYFQLGDVVTALGYWVVSLNYKPKDNIASDYLKKLKNEPKYLENVSAIAKMFNQAIQFAGRRDFDLAFVQLKKIISINSHFVNAYLLMALIYIEQKREGSAKKCLAHVLGIDRTNTIAIHYLREMGETEENILRIADEEETEEDDSDKYYGMEEGEPSGRPIVKIKPEYARGRDKERRIKRKKEVNMAKYSNVYMLTGVVIGILIAFFFIYPSIRQKQNQEIANVEKNYTAQLSSSNNTVDLLNKEVKGLSDELTRQKEENEMLEQTNAQLKSKLNKENGSQAGNSNRDEKLDVSKKSTIASDDFNLIINNE